MSAHRLVPNQSIATDEHEQTPPPYVIRETDAGYELVFDLSGARRSLLHVFLSQDRARLHVMGRKEFDDADVKLLWIFALPKDVDTDEIVIDRKNDRYSIFVPRVKGASASWKPISPTVQHISTSSRR